MRLKTAVLEREFYGELVVTFLKGIYSNVNNKSSEYTMKGDVIFWHNVIHGSKPNLTSNIKVAAMASRASKLASYGHYMKDGEEFPISKEGNNLYNKELSKIYVSEDNSVEEIDGLPIQQVEILDFSDFNKKYKKDFPGSSFSRVGKLFKKDK